MSDNPSRQRFQAAYEGKPPWDLGRPQKAFVEAADQITGSVLDAGCGTGDNALFFAQRGQPVVGIDFVEIPIMEARRKAEELGVEAEFLQSGSGKTKSEMPSLTAGPPSPSGHRSSSRVRSPKGSSGTAARRLGFPAGDGETGVPIPEGLRVRRVGASVV